MNWKPHSQPGGFVWLEKEFLLKGLAAEPILVKDRGEMTNLIMSDGQITIPCTTHRFVKRICRFLFLDLKPLQQCVGEKLNKKQLLPVPLSFEFVLFPLRMAHSGEVKPRGFLWIVHRQVSRVISSNEKANHSELILSNGHKNTVPYSLQFVQQQIKDAYLVDYWFRDAHDYPPLDYRPALSGQAFLHPRDELHFRLLQIAETIRKYSS